MQEQLKPTPTENTVSLRRADFSTLPEVLDYAAQGQTGYNFFGDRGELWTVLTYADLREQARLLARRLLSLGLERGARVAIVADTHPDFQRFFFACQYAGLAPVPLPASIFISGRKAYVAQLRALLRNCRASVAMAPPEFLPFLAEAAEGVDLSHLGTPEVFDRLPESQDGLRPSEPHEIAYLQYTSGSTLFPRGVMITQKSVLANLNGIMTHGLKVRPGDRTVSWLPFYHDMGLVGFVLGPMAFQASVDYLNTRTFVWRPKLWLALMSQTRATISFSPSLGYELCARSLRLDEVYKFDLSAWRVAGVGAETIRSNALKHFAKVLAPNGFKASAFLAAYGMAECALAVSFAPLDQGIAIDHVDRVHLSERGHALPVNGSSGTGRPNTNRFVNCGDPLPDMEVEVRDEQGRVLPDRRAGVIFLRGPAVMSGYFGDPEMTRKVLSPEGWLNTGDMGYRVNGSLVIIGRKKDVIIINGRNIWPQDLEHLSEKLPEVRPGDVSAFAVQGPDHSEMAVMVVQCRESDQAKRANLVRRLRALILKHLGLDCSIDLVPPHTLPRTSSGKISRSRSREEFLKRTDITQLFQRRPVQGSDRDVQPTLPCAGSSH
ncbi:MAG: fatty acyl-AMP ligase [Nitrospiraceae bacterium]